MFSMGARKREIKPGWLDNATDVIEDSEIPFLWGHKVESSEETLECIQGVVEECWECPASDIHIRIHIKVLESHFNLWQLYAHSVIGKPIRIHPIIDLFYIIQKLQYSQYIMRNLS